MPLCDWTKVNPGLFHHFHQRWIGEITDSLNAGRLPADLFALVEQFAGGLHPNSEIEGYAAKASSIVVHQVRGKLIAVIEIVSPGNKSSRVTLRNFVARTAQFLRNGVHIFVVDLFPPAYGNLQGIHKEIWNQFADDDFELPPDKPLTLASYATGDTKAAYVEPVAVGDALPDMPLFLQPDQYILVPLEATYLETWRKCPEPYRQAVIEAQRDAAS